MQEWWVDWKTSRWRRRNPLNLICELWYLLQLSHVDRGRSEASRLLSIIKSSLSWRKLQSFHFDICRRLIRFFKTACRVQYIFLSSLEQDFFFFFILAIYFSLRVCWKLMSQTSQNITVLEVWVFMCVHVQLVIWVVSHYKLWWLAVFYGSDIS